MTGSFTLAQATDGPPPSTSDLPSGGPGATTMVPGGDATIPPSPSGPNMNLIMLLMLGAVFLMVFLPQRRERKRQAQLLQNLKRGDRVVTTAGILGTVVDVSKEEVVIKVDESSNTRMRFLPSAVQAAFGDKSGEAKSEK